MKKNIAFRIGGQICAFGGPVEISLEILRDMEFEFFSPSTGDKGNGFGLKPKCIGVGVETDGTMLGDWARDLFAFFLECPDGLESLRCFHPGTDAELGWKSKVPACFVGFVMETETVGVGVVPPGLANEVVGFGIGGESGQKIRERNVELDLGCPCQSHIINIMKKMSSSFFKM